MYQLSASQKRLLLEHEALCVNLFSLFCLRRSQRLSCRGLSDNPYCLSASADAIDVFSLSTPAAPVPTADVSPISATSLPSPVPMSEPLFTWGDLDSATFIHSIDAAYAEVVHWRKNTFTVPYGNAGKRFVSELSRLFRAYADSSALECVAMRAITVMSILLLQKPFCKSKSRHHSSCLERRIITWLSGDVNNLICEGRSIQKRLPKSSSSSANSNHNLARSFSNLMFQGKTKSALRLLSDKGKGGVLHIKDHVHSTNDPNDRPKTVLDVLKTKTPSSSAFFFHCPY